MLIQSIHSKDNPKIKHLRGLIEQSSFRKKHQQTVLEGVHLLESYLNADPKENFVIFTTEQGLSHPEYEPLFSQLDERNPQFQLYLVTPSIYQTLTLLNHIYPLMTVIDLPSFDQATWDNQSDVLILDQVQDPGNVGTLLRSAAAVGIRQVITTSGTAQLWSPKVLRAAMGAHFNLRLYESIAIPYILNDFSPHLLVTSSHQARNLYDTDLTRCCAWVLGNEGQGVNPDLIQSSQAVAIPQPGGQESLNVAVAGSICLFEMLRQRSYGAFSANRE